MGWVIDTVEFGRCCGNAGFVPDGFILLQSARIRSLLFLRLADAKNLRRKKKKKKKKKKKQKQKKKKKKKKKKKENPRANGKRQLVTRARRENGASNWLPAGLISYS